MFESVVQQQTAFPGFGTKVKELDAAKAAVVEAVESEDETDQLMRQYGIGDTSQRVIERYENAMAAFEEQDAPVSVFKCVYLKFRRKLSCPAIFAVADFMIPFHCTYIRKKLISPLSADQT